MRRLGSYSKWQVQLFCILLLAGITITCSTGTRSSSVSDPLRISVRLPDDTTITAETATTPQQQARGLMFRKNLAHDHGMLFMFSDQNPRGFWMYNTLIPLDIIWIDEDRRIVFISANTPPCPSQNPTECPNYGVGVPARYVLELAAGQAMKHNLKVGEQLNF